MQSKKCLCSTLKRVSIETTGREFNWHLLDLRLYVALIALCVSLCPSVYMSFFSEDYFIIGRYFGFWSLEAIIFNHRTKHFLHRKTVTLKKFTDVVPQKPVSKIKSRKKCTFKKIMTVLGPVTYTEKKKNRRSRIFLRYLINKILKSRTERTRPPGNVNL